MLPSGKSTTNECSANKSEKLAIRYASRTGTGIKAQNLPRWICMRKSDFFAILQADLGTFDFTTLKFAFFCVVFVPGKSSGGDGFYEFFGVEKNTVVLLEIRRLVKKRLDHRLITAKFNEWICHFKGKRTSFRMVTAPTRCVARYRNCSSFSLHKCFLRFLQVLKMVKMRSQKFHEGTSITSRKPLFLDYFFVFFPEMTSKKFQKMQHLRGRQVEKSTKNSSKSCRKSRDTVKTARDMGSASGPSYSTDNLTCRNTYLTRRAYR